MKVLSPQEQRAWAVLTGLVGVVQLGGAVSRGGGLLSWVAAAVILAAAWLFWRLGPEKGRIDGPATGPAGRSYAWRVRRAKALLFAGMVLAAAAWYVLPDTGLPSWLVGSPPV